MIKHICIDWGNTLCPVTGEYTGPMIDWPQLSLIDGVQGALKQLQQRCELSIATNAKESTRLQIDAVMDRLDCKGFFSNVFTPNEMLVGKEDVRYYGMIADKLRINSGDILMIGDDYGLDVRNASEVGFQTCLFNPSKMVSHQMDLPVHQFEVSSWAEILEMIDIPRPTILQAISWLQRENGSYVLLQHVQTVAAIVYWFAIRLRKNGVDVDAILAHRSALLHDLDKLSPGRRREHHGTAGGRMLTEMGYPQVGKIVGSHVIAEPDKINLTSKEAELVFFADKMVKHNQVVSVQERFDDLDDRYPQNRKFRDQIDPFLKEMQAKLCAEIGISSDELLPAIKSELMGRKAS